MKKILVTCALPYANGSIHLGHMLEHIQADIWVRYQKMRNNIVYFICADDTHGTPIMLKAQQLGITPENMINQIYVEHKQDFLNFDIHYDNYYLTHSKEHYQLSVLIYQRLKQRNLIQSKMISQLFDLQAGIFLPDRFVKGCCPKCFALNQYGDNCEICGVTYHAIDLINPISTISGSIPIVKESKHLFFIISSVQSIIYDWIQSGTLQTEVLNKVKEWLQSELKPWDISRDAPYFGYNIPNEPEKYFYVWLDAPIGYISTFQNLCYKYSNINFEEFWNINSTTDLYHFIGKDIIYFHSLFWPAILEGSQFRKPTKLFVHGYLTINGTKMSKSRGTFITARTYLKYFNSDCLRYYYAAKLSSNISDIDLNWIDFMQKINSDIVNKIVNLASRNASFINKYFNGQLSDTVAEPILYNTFIQATSSIEMAFHNRETSYVIYKIISLADLANRYIDQKAPWSIAKKENNKILLQSICSMGIELFRILMIYLKPILPSLAKKVEIFLNTKLSWESITIPLVSHRINAFPKLFHRIEKSKIQAIIKESKQE